MQFLCQTGLLPFIVSFASFVPFVIQKIAIIAIIASEFVRKSGQNDILSLRKSVLSVLIRSEFAFHFHHIHHFQ